MKENNPDSLFLKALNFEIPKEKIETIKDKNNTSSRPLSYISWAYAWGMFKQIYPDARYEIVKNPQGLPYFVDPEAGIMVYTRISANNETHEMFLFVMDSSNNAMRLVPYEYQKWNSYSKSWETKGVKAATMFDINKTLMRCLVKNMSIFGFGLNLYNGDDLPDFNLETDANNGQQQDAQKPSVRRTPTRKTTAPFGQPVSQPAAAYEQYQPQQPTNYIVIAPNDRYAGIKSALNSVTTQDDLRALYMQHQPEVDGNPEIKNLFTLRKQQIQLFNAA